MNRHFSKDDIQMANKHIKKNSTSYDNMQVKTKMKKKKDTSHSLGWLELLTGNKCWLGCRESGTLIHCRQEYIQNGATAWKNGRAIPQMIQHSYHKPQQFYS